MRAVLGLALLALTHGALMRPHHHRQPFTRRTFSAEPVLTAAVDVRDDKGETALILAAEAGAEEQVRSLLASGADATVASFSGWTALHGAAECGSVGIISALAMAGADVSASASSGKTPLDIARQYTQPAACCRLLELGAMANLPKPPGERAGSPRAVPPVMMATGKAKGKGGKGRSKGKEKEPKECSSKCQSSHTKHRGRPGLTLVSPYPYPNPNPGTASRACT